MTAVTASHIYYIKLGRGGDWEAESLRDGVLRFGYREAPHELCANGDWQGVWKAMKEIRGDAGAASRDVNQSGPITRPTSIRSSLRSSAGSCIGADPPAPSNCSMIAATVVKPRKDGATQASTARCSRPIDYRDVC